MWKGVKVLSTISAQNIPRVELSTNLLLTSFYINEIDLLFVWNSKIKIWNLKGTL